MAITKFTKTCPQCGKVFLARLVKQRCCSWPCARNLRWPLGFAEVFWSKVNKRGPNECWPWISSFDKDAYGMLTYRNKTLRANRASWSMANGGIPKGMFVCHSCDNPSCVNPAHLFLGSPADNMRDRDLKGRQCRGSRCHRSKLTEEQVIMVRKAKGKLRDIGKDFGISHNSVMAIKQRRSWKHIPDLPAEEP